MESIKLSKERIEYFSDGVFAIVITLLVLDIRPDVPGGTGWEMFVHAGPLGGAALTSGQRERSPV